MTTPDLTATIAELRALLAAATPGEWRWQINVTARTVELRTTSHEIVIDFARWGMSGATPRFRREIEGGTILENACEWAEPVPGREHDAQWFRSLNHPDAALIAAAHNALPALLDTAERCAAAEAELVPLESMAQRLEELRGRASRANRPGARHYCRGLDHAIYTLRGVTFDDD